MKAQRLRPSPMLVVAAGALVVGLAAPAAASEASHAISGGSIKNHSITGKKLKNNTLTGAQIKESTLGRVPAATTAKRLPALVWHPLTLANGWISFSNAFRQPSYAIDAEGFVHLSGAIKGGLSGSTTFVLPSSAAPKFSEQLVVDENLGTTGRLFVDTEGAGKVSDDPSTSGSAESFTSLDGVEFPLS